MKKSILMLILILFVSCSSKKSLIKESSQSTSISTISSDFSKDSISSKESLLNLVDTSQYCTVEIRDIKKVSPNDTTIDKSIIYKYRTNYKYLDHVIKDSVIFYVHDTLFISNVEESQLLKEERLDKQTSSASDRSFMIILLLIVIAILTCCLLYKYKK